MPDQLTSADSLPARWRCAAELEGQSLVITRVHLLLRRAAAAEGGVLIVAEPGVDVASVALDLHHWSRQLEGPFIGVDCTRERARLDLLLFGTPTIAAVDLEPITSDSRIAAARGGSLFLEDVGELPASVQARLARVIRDGEASIDGQPVSVPLRLIGSATAALGGDVDARRFRLDLHRRLSGSRIDLPPLRQRLEDVPALAVRTLADLRDPARHTARSFTHAALVLLSALTWPGNLAELRRVIARVVDGVTSEVIQIEHLLAALQLDRAPTAFVPAGNLKEARLRFERDYIAAVLQHHGWKMADAARTLGIQRPNLYRKARQLGITLTRAID
ncbi:MAG: sigma 54-interacting transcriptional regulator [Acidobacteriota bacterium]